MVRKTEVESARRSLERNRELLDETNRQFHTSLDKMLGGPASEWRNAEDVLCAAQSRIVPLRENINEAQERLRGLTGAPKRRGPSEHDKESALRKAADPRRHPHMTAYEAAAYLGLGKSAVYDHPELQRVKISGSSKVQFTTGSVIAAKELVAESPLATASKCGARQK